MGVRAKIVVGLVLAAIVVVGVLTSQRESRPAPAKAACGTPVRTMAYADEPERPLRRDGFEQLFRSGAAVRAGGEDAVIEVADVAKLDLPTGRLIAGDPTYEDDLDTPFLVTVPPGSYPVSLSRVRFTATPGTIRVAAARVLVRPEPVTRWALAFSPGEDPAKLGPNEYYGFGVDSGLAALLDASATPSLCRLVAGGDGPLIPALDQDDDSAGVSLRDPATGPNVIAFGAGWGDGSYPTWIGYTASGAVAQFVVDFSVID